MKSGAGLVVSIYVHYIDFVNITFAVGSIIDGASVHLWENEHDFLANKRTS